MGAFFTSGAEAVLTSGVVVVAIRISLKLLANGLYQTVAWRPAKTLPPKLIRLSQS
jgi:hypothetical protein